MTFPEKSRGRHRHSERRADDEFGVFSEDTSIEHRRIAKAVQVQTKLEQEAREMEGSERMKKGREYDGHTCEYGGFWSSSVV
jgi:hypothetical protein